MNAFKSKESLEWNPVSPGTRWGKEAEHDMISIHATGIGDGDIVAH